MKSINKNGIKVFSKLVSGINEVGDAATINNADGAFMAVYVDFLSRRQCHMSSREARVYAVAHRFVQNGDSCPDPDVEFYTIWNDGVLEAAYPCSIDQFGTTYKRHIVFDDNAVPARLYTAPQRDLAHFCGIWMRNIKAQQGL